MATLAGAIRSRVAASAEDQGLTGASPLPVEGNFPSLGGATGWLNSPPLRPAGLRGKVVLVDFWTYTCVNWLRTSPYVRAWSEKYASQGLVVIGVHTPEFPFERNLDNVRLMAKTLKVGYPIATDNDYAIWNAFKNSYWPALFFVDAQGRLRYRYFGEGAYDSSERVIQRLLSEAGVRDVSRGLVSVDPSGLEVAADWESVKSPESYLGYAKAESFVSEHGVWDKAHAYAAPARLRLNDWALSGDWTISKGLAALNRTGGRIACRFHARDLNLVLAPPAPGASVRFRVLLDGQPPGAGHGTDLDEQGNGRVVEPRTYQLIRQRRPIADRRFEVVFLDPGVQAFVFTFG
ncbi:MAG: redoxin family protein [Acetobacteraceae bacterium]|nr:redoxin family protein [Acetobacteraceae bacterium]